MKEALVVMAKAPLAGQVKTRLAATIGTENALSVYLELCSHTKEITRPIELAKVVFYSDYVQPNDLWPDEIYQKRLQSGSDLGARMHNAFEWGFSSGYDSICIVGTDCMELTGEILHNAFFALRSADVVIGPAVDGGYYLLGMRRLHNKLFKGKHWSTPNVFSDTIKELNSDGVSYTELPRLRDVDVEADLPEMLRRKVKMH